MGFAVEAALTAVAITGRSAPLQWGADWAGLRLLLVSDAGGGSGTGPGGSGSNAGTETECLLTGTADAAAVPGYRTRAAACGTRGRGLLLGLPGGGADELLVKVCVSVPGSPAVDAVVSVREG